MNDRTYRAILGGLILTALYFDINRLMNAIIAILIIEGVTNYRIPLQLNKFYGKKENAADRSESSAKLHKYRFNFESERAWRLLVGFLLLLTYCFFYHSMWFFPWFMGFSILGAGVSGVCPMEITIKRIGFR